MLKDPNYSKPSHPTIALFGTFDVDNYGDCLFPLIVKHLLTKRLGEITLYPFSPTNRLPRIANYSRVYGYNELSKVLHAPPDCFVIGGGELLSILHGHRVYLVPRYTEDVAITYYDCNYVELPLCNKRDRYGRF